MFNVINYFRATFFRFELWRWRRDERKLERILSQRLAPIRGISENLETTSDEATDQNQKLNAWKSSQWFPKNLHDSQLIINISQTEKFLFCNYTHFGRRKLTVQPRYQSLASLSPKSNLFPSLSFLTKKKVRKQREPKVLAKNY